MWFRRTTYSRVIPLMPFLLDDSTALAALGLCLVWVLSLRLWRLEAGGLMRTKALGGSKMYKKL